MMEILYKKKVIRDFLSLYNEKFWIPLISHICEYGIILFKKKYTIASLNPEDIYKIIENFKIDENIYEKKPKMNYNNINRTKKISHNKSKSKSISKNENKSFGFNKKNNSSEKNILSKNKSLNNKNFQSSRNNTPNKYKTEEFKNKITKKTLIKNKNNSNCNSKKNIQTLINLNNKISNNKTLNNTHSNLLEIENEKKYNMNNIKNNNYKPINKKIMSQKYIDLNIKTTENLLKDSPEVKKEIENEKIKNLKGENKLKALIELDREKKYAEIKKKKDNNLQYNKINSEINNSNQNETPKVINTNTNMILTIEEENKFKKILDENNNCNFNYNKLKLSENSPINIENNLSNALYILKTIEEKNNNINNNENNKKERYCLNDAPIISFEDKINNLTKKLSKLNSSSYNKNNELISSNMNNNKNNNLFQNENEFKFSNNNSINLNNNNKQNLHLQNEGTKHSNIFSSEDYDLSK